MEATYPVIFGQYELDLMKLVREEEGLITGAGKEEIKQDGICKIIQKLLKDIYKKESKLKPKGCVKNNFWCIQNNRDMKVDWKYISIQIRKDHIEYMNKC